MRRSRLVTLESSSSDDDDTVSDNVRPPMHVGGLTSTNRGAAAPSPKAQGSVLSAAANLPSSGSVTSILSLAAIDVGMAKRRQDDGPQSVPTTHRDETRVAELVDEIASLKHANKRLSGALAATKTAAEEEITQCLRKARAEWDRDRAVLEDTIEELRKRNGVLGGDTAKREQREASLLKDHKTLKQRHDALREALDKSHNEANACGARVELHRANELRLTQELDELRQQSLASEGEISRWRAAVTALEARFDQRGQELEEYQRASTREAAKQREAALATAQRTQQTHEGELKRVSVAAEKEAHALEAALHEAQSEATHLRTELTAQQRSANSSLQSIAATVEHVKAALSHAREEEEHQLESRAVQAEKAKAKAEAKVAELTATCRTQAEAAAAQVASLQLQLGSAESLVARAQATAEVREHAHATQLAEERRVFERRVAFGQQDVEQAMVAVAARVRDGIVRSLLVGGHSDASVAGIGGGGEGTGGSNKIGTDVAKDLRTQTMLLRDEIATWRAERAEASLCVCGNGGGTAGTNLNASGDEPILLESIRKLVDQRLRLAPITVLQHHREPTKHSSRLPDNDSGHVDVGDMSDSDRRGNYKRGVDASQDWADDVDDAALAAQEAMRSTEMRHEATRGAVRALQSQLAELRVELSTALIDRGVAIGRSEELSRALRAAEASAASDRQASQDVEEALDALRADASSARADWDARADAMKRLSTELSLARAELTESRAREAELRVVLAATGVGTGLVDRGGNGGSALDLSASSESATSPASANDKMNRKHRIGTRTSASPVQVKSDGHGGRENMLDSQLSDLLARQATLDERLDATTSAHAQARSEASAAIARSEELERHLEAQTKAVNDERHGRHQAEQACAHAQGAQEQLRLEWEARVSECTRLQARLEESAKRFAAHVDDTTTAATINTQATAAAEAVRNKDRLDVMATLVSRLQAMASQAPTLDVRTIQECVRATSLEVHANNESLLHGVTADVKVELEALRRDTGALLTATRQLPARVTETIVDSCPGIADSGKLLAKLESNTSKIRSQLRSEAEGAGAEAVSLCAATRADGDWVRAILSLGVAVGVAGVGLYFTSLTLGHLVVTDITPEGPAERCGTIRLEDQLIAVDGQSTRNMDVDDVRDIVVAEPGTYVTLAFRRPILQDERDGAVSTGSGSVGTGAGGSRRGSESVYEFEVQLLRATPAWLTLWERIGWPATKKQKSESKWLKAAFPTTSIVPSITEYRGHAHQSSPPQQSRDIHAIHTARPQSAPLVSPMQAPHPTTPSRSNRDRERDVMSSSYGNVNESLGMTDMSSLHATQGGGAHRTPIGNRTTSPTSRGGGSNRGTPLAMPTERSMPKIERM